MGMGRRDGSRRVAVIGGGVVGCTVAWRIRQALGYQVDLHERRDDILLETSAGTSNRFHRGYQYARSPETAASLRAYQQRFEQLYGGCIVPSANYYGVADDSAISPAAYLDFCARCELPLEHDRPPGVFTDNVVLSVRSAERSLDPETLRDLCRRKLCDWDVSVVHTEASRSSLEGYDHVIAATYSNPNLLRRPSAQREHHFSLCEMVLVELPEQYARRSAMIVYGPFMTVDVVGSTGNHVLYHGEHGVHHANVGRFADVPAVYQPFLYRYSPADEVDGLSRAPLALASARRYFAGLDHARHIASNFVVRVQAPTHVRDAVRRTTIEEFQPGWFSITASKLSASASIADTMVELLQRRRTRRGETRDRMARLETAAG
jgi:hypothetical protein